MPNEIRVSHHSYGYTIPVLNIFVGANVDVFEEVGSSAPDGGPSLRAELGADAGPISVPVYSVPAPISNTTSQTVQLINVPVPIPFVKTINIDVQFKIVDYTWKAAAAGVGAPGDGLVTFGIQTRLEFKVPFDPNPITLQLGPAIPVSIAVTNGSASSDAMFSADSSDKITAGLTVLQILVGA